MTENAFSDVIGSDDEQVREDIVDGVDFGSSTRGKLIPFSYYGGKYKHLNWLLPLLPNRKAYVEPFGGSGVVLLNREPSDVETFNDKYDEISTFFKVLREKPTELLQKIQLSPYHEGDFEDVENCENLNDIEKARRFFIIVTQAYNGQTSNPSWSYNTSYSSRGVSKKVSNYQAKMRRLQPIADRLTNVQVCSRDAIDVIQTFDTENGVIYCDPPYPSAVRQSSDSYAIEMSEEKHREMAEVLRSCEADVAVSSYRGQLYEEEFVENGWKCVDGESKKLSASPNDGSERVESLYVNYDITDEMLTKAFD